MSAASDPMMMLACDKNGAKNVAGGDACCFGGNHAGDGGNVLKVDGSVAWCPIVQWSDAAPGGGRDQALGGVKIGSRNISDR